MPVYKIGYCVKVFWQPETRNYILFHTIIYIQCRHPRCPEYTRFSMNCDNTGEKRYRQRFGVPSPRYI